MEIHEITAPQNEVDYIFFVAAFQHHDLFYRASVVQNVPSLREPEYGGLYFVTLQSSESLQQFVMFQDAEDIWGSDSIEAPQEIIFLLGKEIEKIYQRQDSSR